jgi:hypothetical protein
VATTPTQANLHDVHEVKGSHHRQTLQPKFHKVCHIKKLRDPFFIHAGALHTRTCASGFFRFVLAGIVTRCIILGCM